MQAPRAGEQVPSAPQSSGTLHFASAPTTQQLSQMHEPSAVEQWPCGPQSVGTVQAPMGDVSEGPKHKSHAQAPGSRPSHTPLPQLGGTVQRPEASSTAHDSHWQAPPAPPSGPGVPTILQALGTKLPVAVLFSSHVGIPPRSSSLQYLGAAA